MNLFEKRELLWKFSLLVLVSLVGLSLYSYSDGMASFSSELGFPLLNENNQQTCSFVNEWIPTYFDGNVPNAKLIVSDFAMDTAGNFYITDTENGFVHKYNINGRHLESIGLSYNERNGLLAEIAVDSNHFVYVIDSSNSKIRKYSFNNPGSGERIGWGSRGSGNGQFNIPQDIAVDSSNNIYIADKENMRIQKFDSNGRFLMKFSTDTFKPTRIAVDRSGNIYIVPVQSIRSGKIKKYSSNGIFLSEWDVFSPPNDLFVDDKVYIGVNGGVKVYSLDGMFLYDAGIDFPNSLGGGSFIKHNNKFYISETQTLTNVNSSIYSKIKKFSCNAESSNVNSNTPPTSCFFVKAWGSRGSGNGQFNLSTGIDVDSNHNIYVTEFNNNRVQKFDSDGNFLRKWGSSGTRDGQFNIPTGITLDKDDNVYVVDTSRVQKFDSNGRFLRKYNINGWGWDVVLGSSDNFFVSQGGEINEYNINTGYRSTPTFIVFPPSLSNSLGLAFDSSNRRLFVGFDRIYNFYEEANNQDIAFGSYGSGNGQLNYPMGLDIDYNNNYLYEADTGNGRVQIFTLDGRYVNKFGDNDPRNGKLSSPRDVAYDYNNGEHLVYVTDPNRVLKFKCDNINLNNINPSVNVPISPPSNIPYVNECTPGEQRTVCRNSAGGNPNFPGTVQICCGDNSRYDYSAVCSVNDYGTWKDWQPVISCDEEPVVPETQISCSDSDGLSPSIYGRVTSTSGGSSESYSDSCISNSNYLWEYSCDSNGLWKQNCYKCDLCSNGKCVNAYKRHAVAECENIERSGA
ncbi:MAG TPA: hypothetical protein HA226_00165 [Nanoarchaeota archaeon]|nr:hypothetical protein [Nanoarchaeota archaeon]